MSDAPSPTTAEQKVFWRVESYKGRKLIRTDDFRRKITAELYALGLMANVRGFTRQIIKSLPMPK